ncbi:hypothetical protein V6N11_079699 [Hibiscus sabdariffa]|uniref:Uncharacterized protein n=1 Tax=Hibiscus sabdariffa TaxID=183260 RepID=A0ABR2RW55_9ROSI
MGLVVFPLVLVLLIQSVAGHDERIKDFTDFNSDDVALSPVQVEERKIPIELGYLETSLIRPDVLSMISSTPEMKSWMAKVIYVYRSIAVDATVNAKGIAPTLADSDPGAIKKMCEHVKEAFRSASLKANDFDVATISPEEDKKAIEFSFFLPVMSMVNAGLIKPEVVKKVASSPETKAWLAKFEQGYYRSLAGYDSVSVEGLASTSVDLDIDDVKKMEEQIREAVQSGSLSGQADAGLKVGKNQ